MKHSGRKGWEANHRDTYSLDMTLSPIILAGLVKFRDTMNSEQYVGCFGVPSRLVLGDSECIDAYDEAAKVWAGIIDEMIYAFDLSNEPDINDYGIEFNTGNMDDDLAFGITCTTPEALEHMKADEKVHYERKAKGLALFGEYYSDLWW
jgi:hypothetical protein